MTVGKLIQLLQKEVDKEDMEIAELEFWVGDKELELKSLSGFGLSPDIVFNFKEIEPKDKILCKPAVFKKKVLPKVSKAMKKIEKEMKNGIERK